MAIGINFSKDKTAYLMNCLKEGKTIEGVKTLDDMLALAGACHAVVFSHGPWNRKDPNFNWKGIPAERKEAIDETLSRDIHDAIDWYSMMAFKILDGEYDRQLEPNHRAIIYREDDNKAVQVHPVCGFRDSPRRN